MKAIETHYKGYRFRSRLEARWAVFFDELRLKWLYEHEGFDLGPCGWYLPDFQITADIGESSPWVQYVEVKGEPPTDLETQKCVELVRQSGRLCHILEGDPYDVRIHFITKDGVKVSKEGVLDSLRHLTFMAWSLSGFPGSTSDLLEEVPRAALKARSARFEHGGSGAWQR